jgi:hypothetical protein
MFAQDVRSTVRSPAKSGFQHSCTSLALGIGANTAIFSIAVLA